MILVLFEWLFVSTLLLTLLIVKLSTARWLTRALPVLTTIHSGAVFVGVGCLLSALQYTLTDNWLYFAHGVFGQLSATSLVLMCMLFCEHILKTPFATHTSRHTLLISVCITGSLFYPFALGLGQLNPYNLGFGNIIMLGNCVLIALVCIFLRYWLGFYLLLIALSMQMLQLHESTNLWDYLLDGLVYLYSLYYCVKWLVRWAWSRLTAHGIRGKKARIA